MAEVGGVLCCGNIVFDMLVHPVEDVGWGQTKWVETISECLGGNGANTSYVLAQLGIPVRLVSQTGDDDRGDRLIGILRNAGVDISQVGRLPGESTAATCVLVQSDGARRFYHRPGASRQMDPAALRFDLPGITHFHLANPFSMTRIRASCGDILRNAKQAGLSTSVDTGWDSLGRWMQDLGPALPFTDILFVNEAEAEMLGGQRNLQTSGLRDLIVKTGAAGCLVNGDRVSGFPANAIDTTGAGDCFAGAFLAGLCRGLTLPECARLANAVGALNVEHLGSVTGIRDYDGTIAWMNAR